MTEPGDTSYSAPCGFHHLSISHKGIPSLVAHRGKFRNSPWKSSAYRVLELWLHILALYLLQGAFLPSGYSQTATTTGPLLDTHHWTG
ncbi:hypothetical protein L211DRAFT_836613 [Terfezia boudieri ATCC MYA-4762]|uniref:Uncharacterized protein n=1 Tax=Terfezia boudieri ATCC MYA-4762 TaxID=1051890 RepID=A0A3N4LR08_9PEZI|nr:hypothetical protein L211DRAFT_836613 [Terfezia boudieri ATCC MYA-4762]